MPQMKTAIKTAIAAAFPDFRTVEFDRDDESEDFPTPAVLLEFVEAEPAPSNDAGTGQWCALARFEARVLLNARKTARGDVAVIAVALSAWLNLRRFPGVFVDPCQVIACEPDEFAPNVEKFRTWRIEWVMPAMFGNSAWLDVGDPTESLFSFAPYIGVPYEDDYSPIEGPLDVTP